MTGVQTCALPIYAFEQRPVYFAPLGHRLAGGRTHEGAGTRTMAIAMPPAPAATQADTHEAVAHSRRAPQLPASRLATDVRLPELPEHVDPHAFDAQSLLRETVDGARLLPEAALWLLEHAETEAIRSAADIIRRRRYPDDRATFIIDRNINYTNACVIKCTFCAFYRLPEIGRAHV